MEDTRKTPDREREPQLHQPEEAVKDLEPDEKVADKVTGGVVTEKITY